jgi:hypothetical protein
MSWRRTGPEDRRRGKADSTTRLPRPRAATCDRRQHHGLVGGTERGDATRPTGERDSARRRGCGPRPVRRLRRWGWRWWSSRPSCRRCGRRASPTPRHRAVRRSRGRAAWSQGAVRQCAALHRADRAARPARGSRCCTFMKGRWTVSLRRYAACGGRQVERGGRWQAGRRARRDAGLRAARDRRGVRHGRRSHRHRGLRSALHRGLPASGVRGAAQACPARAGATGGAPGPLRAASPGGAGHESLRGTCLGITKMRVRPVREQADLDVLTRVPARARLLTAHAAATTTCPDLTFG